MLHDFLFICKKKKKKEKKKGNFQIYSIVKIHYTTITMNKEAQIGLLQTCSTPTAGGALNMYD